MQQSSIPICSFPSTAIFLDDNHDFLLNFVLQLDETVAYKTFDDASTALNYIQNKQSNADSLSLHCLSDKTSAQENSDTHRTIDLDLASIYKEIYNPNRFSEVSVVVVDYAMPGMDGLEFCRRIKNKNIKKILLSGKADEKLAIAAFNEGLINCYVKKSDVDAAEQVTQSLNTLQQQYFHAMSDTIAKMLSLTSPNYMHDLKFTQCFHALCQEHNIVEYYLIDNLGSYLLINDDAHLSLLRIQNKRDTTEQILQTASSSVLFQAEEQDYYALIQPVLPMPIQQEKILSYNRYLEELDAEALLID